MRSSRSTQYVTTNIPLPSFGLVHRSTAPLILLLAALLRFYNLSGQSLWADEGNSVALARRSFVEIARHTAFDIHPPLYYWLLKVWTSLFGESEMALRSLSVVLGVGLVYLIGVLGTRMFSPRVGLIAAFIAALSPLQVYYSQETRMYMLLTLLGSLTMLAAYLIFQNSQRKESLFFAHRWYFWLKTPAGLIYILTVTAGLYTHYAYPLILLAVNLTVLGWFWRSAISNTQRAQYLKSQISNWLLLQLIPILLYLPWLPIAWRQITTWPSEKQSASFSAVLEIISTTLLFGLSWPFNLELIPVIGLALMFLVTGTYASGLSFPLPLTSPGHPLVVVAQSKPHRFPLEVWERLILLWLWFLLPVTLTLFIFSPAFLKFLLVAAPALALLLALTVEGIGGWGAAEGHAPRTVSAYLASSILLIVLTTTSALSLYSYYTNATYARDNYRRIVSFIKAVSGPEDAVILNAEGQQDVFNYYYTASAMPQAPVYPLPRRRPLDEAETLAELQAIADSASKIYVVYWATQQADPNGLIENWLDRHLFKATDQWYGNVRLASYASLQVGAKLPLTPVDYPFGPHIRLVGYALSATEMRPGDILQVALSWNTDAALSSDENYTVFTQLLDQNNHLAGQRDALPRLPAPDWPVNQPVADAHGIFIEPGTPPGLYRLIVGLYNSQTGQRLLLPGGQDFVELGQVKVIRQAIPLSPEAFTIQVPLNAPMLEVTLLGYDLYKLGHRSTPTTPLHPGDPVQLVAYWAVQQPVRRLQDQLFIQVVTNWGETTPIFMTRQPAGMDYPIQEWQEGEIVRAQYNFFLEGLPSGTYRLALTLNASQVSMQQVVALTKPFQVE